MLEVQAKAVVNISILLIFVTLAENLGQQQ